MEEYYVAYKLIPEMGMSWLVPSIFGFIGFILLMYHFRVKQEMFSREAFFGILFLIAGIFIPFKLYKWESDNFHEIKDRISKKQYKEIKGEIEDFKPAYGKGMESFKVDGVLFEYNDYHDNYGFHQTCSQGGPICKNGFSVQIKYFDFEDGNDIIELKIKKENK